MMIIVGYQRDVDRSSSALIQNHAARGGRESKGVRVREVVRSSPQTTDRSTAGNEVGTS